MRVLPNGQVRRKIIVNAIGVVCDAETAHDPKTGQFTAGSGAKPATPNQHRAQAAYHGEMQQHHEHQEKRSAGYERLQKPHNRAAHEHREAKKSHISAAGHHHTVGPQAGAAFSKRAHEQSAVAEQATKAAPYKELNQQATKEAAKNAAGARNPYGNFSSTKKPSRNS